MATEKQLQTRIQLKYDSLANWTAHGNIVLKAGEIGICAVPTGETTVNGDINRPQILFKVGDGKTAFVNLPWASATAADVYAWAKQDKLPVQKVGTGNVVSNIYWDESIKGIKFETIDVATAASFKEVSDNLTALTTKVDGMYTNEQIDTKVAAAKKAGDDAANALAEYKTANDAAVAAAKKAGDDAADALATYKTNNDAVIEDIVDGTTPVAKATNAEFATKDSDGNNIATTYAKKTDVEDYQTSNDARVKLVEDDVAAIKNAENGILAQAKAYADELDGAMDERVLALEAIKHEEFAKSADVVSNTTFETFQTENTAAIKAAANKAQENAEKYADDLKDALLGEGIKDTFDTLVEIQTWIEGAGVNATELTEAIAAEAKLRSDEDTRLNNVIEGEITRAKAAEEANAANIAKIANGTTVVKEAEKATQDGSGNVITSHYETKSDATAKLAEAKTYSDTNLATAKAYTDELKTALEAADTALDSRIDDLEEAFAGGVANEAAKVSHKLTIKTEDGNSAEFDGSAAVTVDLSAYATDAQVKTAADQAQTNAESHANTLVSAEETRAIAAEKRIAEFGEDGALTGGALKTLADNHVNTITAGTGLKAEKTGNTYDIAFDDTVVFVFNCGSATELVD